MEMKGNGVEEDDKDHRGKRRPVTWGIRLR